MKRLLRSRLFWIITIPLILLALCTPDDEPRLQAPEPIASSSTPTADASTAQPAQVDPDSVLWAAMQLPTRDRDRVDYKRAKFGQAWTDVDQNGCDTRNDVLRRDLRKRHTVPGTRGCVMAKGQLKTDDLDSYAGVLIVNFERGDREVEIDHTVALADAWRAGAHAWDNEKRMKFANDPMNLEAIDTKTNRDKGDKTFNRWKPDDFINVCYFAARVVAIKHRYELTATEAEKKALVTSLSSEDCKSEDPPLPTLSEFKWPKPKPMGEPKPKPKPKPEPRPEPQEPSVYYENCTDARSQGGAPVHRGDPGYGRHLDRDGDGVGCES